MFVYVAEFEGRPGLVKIGVAVDIDRRLAGLVKSHGELKAVREFNMGGSSYAVESFVHKVYKESRILLDCRCDGYTEFFDEAVRADVFKIMENLSAVLSVEPPSSTAPTPTPERKGKLEKLQAAKAKLEATQKDRESRWKRSAEIRDMQRTHLKDIIAGCAVFLPKEWLKRCGMECGFRAGVFNTLLSEVGYRRSNKPVGKFGKYVVVCHPVTWSTEQIKESYLG